jgi:hypothetical protein
MAALAIGWRALRVVGHEAQIMGKSNTPADPQPPGLRPAPAM